MGALIQHGSKNLMSVGEDSRALVWLNADIEACYGALMQEADAGEGGNAGSPGASGSPPKLAEGEQEFSADSTTFGEAFMALKKIYMAEYETEVPAVVVVQGGGGQENNALQKDPSVYLDFFEKRWLKKRVAFQRYCQFVFAGGSPKVKDPFSDPRTILASLGRDPSDIQQSNPINPSRFRQRFDNNSYLSQHHAMLGLYSKTMSGIQHPD